MQLLLLCGALLGVASQVLITEQHTSIQSGAVSFSWRGNMASFNSAQAKIGLIKVDFSSTKSHDCSSAAFMGGSIDTDWYSLRATNKDQPIPITRNDDSDGVLFQTGPIDCEDGKYDAAWGYKNTCGSKIPVTNGLEPGKYRMCGCFGATCDKDVAANKAQYSTTLGYLHVVESTPILGTLSNSQSVGSPRLFLQSDVNATASWLFSNAVQDSKAALDQFMVIDVDTAPFKISNGLYDPVYLGAYSCGQTSVNGKTAHGTVDSVLTSSLIDTEVYGCTNTNTNAGLANYEMASCKKNFLRTSKVGLEKTQSAGSSGYLCYCDASNEENGLCNNYKNFGAALGPILYRSFSLSASSSKHYTITAASAPSGKQSIAIPSGNTVTDLAIGLVRLDVPSTSLDHGITSLSPKTASRVCGWSNLDPFPHSSTSSGGGVYAVAATNGVVEFDFSTTFNRKYAVCACDGNNVPTTYKTIENVFAGGVVGKECPNPAVYNPGGIKYNSNGHVQGRMYQTFYSQNVGTLHVVTLLTVDTGVLLQASVFEHVSVFFASRKARAPRKSDAEYLQESGNLQKLTKSRFYITEGADSTCGVSPPTTLIHNLNTENSMHVKTSATSKSGADGRFEMVSEKLYTTNINSGPIPENSKFGYVFSLATGWDTDNLKRSGGVLGQVGSEDLVQEKQQSLYVAREQGFKIMSSEGAIGKTFKLCFCDQATEFEDSTKECASSQSDYSHFGAEVGKVKVSKFSFNSLALQENRHHYTVQKRQGSTFTLAVPEASSATKGTADPSSDRYGLIPAYGDGTGVDVGLDAEPSFGQASDPAKNTIPVKTEFFCGKTPLGTKHSFLKAGAWIKVVGNPKADAKHAPYSFSAGSTSTSLIATLDATNIQAYKYKVCVCSKDAWGEACPDDHTDDMQSDLGHKNAFRFADFAGYLHVVDTTNSATLLTISAGKAPDANLIKFNVEYGHAPDVSKSKSFYADDTLKTCGRVSASSALAAVPTNAYDAGTGVLTISIPATQEPWAPAVFRNCFCDYHMESLDEAVTDTNTYANAPCNSVSNYGATLGQVSIMEFATSNYLLSKEGSTGHYGQHFTVTTEATVQTIAIMKKVKATNLSPKSTNPDNMDKVGFLTIEENTVPTCGASSIPPTLVAEVGEEDSTDLKVSFDFANAKLTANSVSVVCYCQVKLLPAGEKCDAGKASNWHYAVGYLHVVDMKVWPQEFVLPIAIHPTQEFKNMLPIIGLNFKTDVSIQADSSKLLVSGATIKDTFRCGAITESQSGSSTTAPNIDSTTFIVTEANGWGKSAADGKKVLVNVRGTEKYTETIGPTSYKHLCLCDRREFDPFTGQKKLKYGCQKDPSAGTDSSALDEKSLGYFGVTVGRVWTAKSLKFPGEVNATASKKKRRVPALFEHFTTKTSAAAEFFMQGEKTANAQLAVFAKTDYVGFAKDKPFTTGPQVEVRDEVATSSVCGVDTVDQSTAIVPTTNGAASVTISTLDLIKTLDGNQKTNYKFIVCLCREIVTGTCDKEKVSSYFNMAGYLHVIKATIPYQVGVSSGYSYTDLSVTFSVKPSSIDRLALVPVDSSSARSTCGRYRKLSAQVNPPVANWLLYESVVTPPTESNKLSQLQHYDLLSSVYVSSTGFSNAGVYEWKMLIPEVRFLKRQAYEICFCSYKSENGCPSSTLANFNNLNSTLTSGYSYYRKYGASLGTIKALTFLTFTSSQTFTVFAGATPNSKLLKIWKTSASSVVHSSTDDKWALALSTSTCGDKSSSALKSKSIFKFGTMAAVPTKSFLPCENAANGYDCNVNSGGNRGMETATGLGSFTGLAIDKFKLCLCSAVGTSDDGKTCDQSSTTGLRDYGDHAGYVYVVDAPADQRVEVVLDSKTSVVTVMFGAGQVVKTTDRLALIEANGMCGDADFVKDSAMFGTGTTLNMASLTIGKSGADTTLSTGALQFKQGGKYSLCYCSSTLESACQDKKDYGITIADLYVNDLSLNTTGSVLVKSVGQGKILTTSFSYSSTNSIFNGTTLASASLAFTNAKTCLATHAAGDSMTSKIIVPTSGGTIDVDFSNSNIKASTTPWTLCVYTGSSALYAELDSVKVWVSDLTTTPKVAPRSASVAVKFVYTDFVKFSKQHVYYLADAYSCGDSNLPYTGTSTEKTTGVHGVPSTAGEITFDFSNTKGSGFHACIAEGCDIDGTHVCTAYYDLSNSESAISVYESLTVSPTIVTQSSAVKINISASGVLDKSDAMVWFQNVDAPCTETPPKASSASTTVAVKMGAPGNELSFDFSKVTVFSQNLFQLCSKKCTNADTCTKGAVAVPYQPTGVRVVDIQLSKQTVAPGAQTIKFSSAATSSQATPSILTADLIYFTTGKCSAVTPAASSVSTDTHQFSTEKKDYTFDFSKITNGVAKLCVVPTGTNAGTVYSYESASTLVTVVDIQISPSAVYINENVDNNVPVTFTYGKNAGFSTDGKFHFSRDCTVTDLNQEFDKADVPESKSPALFNFKPANAATFNYGQGLFSLCYTKDSKTIPYKSIGILATTMAVAPNSVSKSSKQDLEFTYKAGELKLNDVVSLVQSSFACGTAASNVSTSPVSVTSGGTSWTGTFDFSVTAVSSDPYRVCVKSGSSGEWLDLSNVAVHVTDLSLQPSASGNSQTTFRFTSENGKGQAPSSAIAVGDIVWLQSPISGACTEYSALPVNDYTSHTPTKTVKAGTEFYDFSFAAATTFGNWLLCAYRGTDTRSFTNVVVYLAKVKQSVYRIDEKTASENIDITFSTGSLITGTSNADSLFFLSSSVSDCELYAATAKLMSGPLHSQALALTDNSIAVDTAHTAQFVFTNTTASDTSFRLCISRVSPEIVIDLPGNTLMVQKLELEKNIVNKRTNETVVIKVTAGLAVGDKVFFKATACGSELPVASTDSSDTQTVKFVSGGLASLNVDFSKVDVNANNKLLMCVQRPGSSNVFENTKLEATVLAADVNPLGDPSKKSVFYGVVRQSDTGPGFYLSSTIGANGDKVYFMETGTICLATDPTTAAGSGTRTRTEAVAVAGTDGLDTATPFKFSTVGLSTNLYRLCVWDGANGKSYSGVGVLVSDLSIMGSPTSDLSAVGCVDAAASQSITFSMSSTLVFKSTSSLYFKRYVEGDNDVTCGSVPTTSTTSMSGPVKMGIIDPSTSVDNILSWTQKFDFSKSLASTDVYRLCVVKSSGVTVDFSPLGVRISDVKITSSFSGGKNSFAPLLKQPIVITSSESLQVNDKIYFIDTSVKKMTCVCAYDDTCPTQDTSPVSSQVTITSTEATSYEIDFDKFTASTSASMCVRRGTDVHALTCKSVSFTVSVSPPSVPANTGQLLALNFEGVSLLAKDVVMWAKSSSECTASTNFTTASTTNPTQYSSSAIVTSSGSIMSFDFGKSLQGNTLMLCVRRDTTVYKLTGTTILVTEAVNAVGIGGDPHVRAADGKWLDFYGEAGVYSLLDSDNVQANAKFGYAVRDNHMIWHPKVMRPGTLMEEIGIKLLDEKINIRLAVHGGGIVSIRKAAESTQFWTSIEDREMKVGDYSITWAACQKACEVVMPWGSHERARSLIVEGRGEFLQMFVTKSGGYRFVDMEAMPSQSATGLLADAQGVPATLAARLMTGGEKDYKVVSTLIESY